MNETSLLSVEDALNTILSFARPLEPEVVDVAAALGRALSEDVLARRTLPPRDNSAMDGYALRATDAARAPCRLRVVETIFAGQQPSRALGPGEAARIMTGAPLPEGADAVVMQERTRAAGDEVEILEAPTAHQFIRPRGEDAREGERLLPAGVTLGVGDAALLWAQGITQVKVPRRPRVALLSTGDELCAVDDPPGIRIVDTNGPALGACVRGAGALPHHLGIARDLEEDVLALFERTRGFDVVLSSAGVSVGDKDFVRRAVDRLGVTPHFWRVAIKPGKPLLFGTLGASLYFGLPGNPASSLVTFELFVRPALRRLAGAQFAGPPRVSGVADEDFTKQAGLTHFIRVTAEWRDGDLHVRPLRTQTSGAIRSTASATHLLVFHASNTRITKGARVELIPVSWNIGS